MRGDRPFTTRPFAPAFIDLLAGSGSSQRDVVARLGPGFEALDGDLREMADPQLSLQQLRAVRRLFGLAPGYFAEERELVVLHRVRQEPSLRDSIYFELIRRGHAHVPPEAPVVSSDALPVPLAPPSHAELVVLAIDTSTGVDSPARSTVERSLAAVIRSQRTASTKLSVVAFNGGGVASTPALPAAEAADPGISEEIWSAVLEPEEAEPPRLSEALAAVTTVAREFVGVVVDIPAVVTVLVVSSGAYDDAGRVRAAAACLHQVPSTTVRTVHCAVGPLASTAHDVLAAVATEAGHPVQLADAPLDAWIFGPRFV